MQVELAFTSGDDEMKKYSLEVRLNLPNKAGFGILQINLQP